MSIRPFLLYKYIKRMDKGNIKKNQPQLLKIYSFDIMSYEENNML